jgi:8-oxo-dGTP pyrophosphatase MutT (NUDIX family)
MPLSFSEDLNKDPSPGYLRHILALNPAVTEPFVPWSVEQRRVGWLRPALAELLLKWDRVFVPRDDGIGLHPRLQTFEQRTEALAEVISGLHRDAIVHNLLGEPYSVTAAGRDSALCSIDRGSVAQFGVRSFGQHLNGYVHRGDQLWMWIGRRARDRKIFPGALDQLVAGGLPHGVGLMDNLVKECHEEAGMDESLARKAHPVGALTYNRTTDKGFRPDVLYCYDLELPDDFEPRNTDGEVEEFLLLPIQEVARLVRETDEFKLNCNLVVIDFLIRHGLLTPEHPEFLEITTGLHPDLDSPLRKGVQPVGVAELAEV